MEIEYKRKCYIELLRVISMIAVVFTHVGSTASTDFTESYYNSLGGVFQASVVNLSHFAVPVFFMITGALLLNKDKKLSLNKLFSKYIFKYIMVILVFGGIFAFIEILFNTKTISLNNVFLALLNTVNGKTWNHMWYMYELIGVTLTIPIIKVLVDSDRDDILMYIMFLLLLFESILPFFHINPSIKFPIKTIYIFYLIIGHMIEESKIIFSTKVATFFTAISVIVLIYAAYLSIMLQSMNKISEYFSPIIIIYSVSLFSIFKNTKIQINYKLSKLVNLLSNVSFGVYLIHMFYMNLAFKLFRINPLVPNAVLGLILIGGGVLLCSVLTVCFLKKLPIINKLL